MEKSDIIPLSDGVYEMREGVGDRKLGEGDLAKLLFGGIAAASTPQSFLKNNEVFLPSSLEEDKLKTLFVSYDGSYDDDQGKRQYLVSTVLKVVQSMKEGQKVFIIEEKGDEMEGEEEEVRDKLLTAGPRWKHIWVVKMVDISESTHGGQQPRNHTVDANRGWLENHGTNRKNHTSDQQRQRGWSPVPPAFFKTQAFDLLLKLWGLRLCPESMNNDVRKALEETHCQLPFREHQLLCIGSWQFQSTESDPWEFYRFTFHEKLETERHGLFNNIRRIWNDSTREELTTEQVTQWWRNMICATSEMIKAGLSAKQYPCCDCVVTQLHSCNDLQGSIALLETLDKNETGERAQQVIVAFTSLRVIDMIEEEFRESQHQSVGHYRQVASDVLKELQDDQKLPKGIQSKLKGIIEYEEERLNREDLLGLEYLADLKVSG